MPDEPPIASGVETLAATLRRNNFRIPRHQRPYDWEPEKHVCRLLNDLEKCIARKQPYHFLGTIMFIAPNSAKSEGRLDINDGQQRIATFMLICANLCRHFRDCGYSAGETAAMRLLFDLKEGHNNTLADADDLTPRITLAISDKTTYEHLTCGHPVRQNGKMNDAWKAIDGFFSRPEYASVEAKKTFFSFLLNNVQVAWLNFQEAADAISVFETQNTRGKSLEQIQLVCAHFLYCVRDNEVRSERLHEQIQKVRGSLRNEEKRFFEYARCFFQSRYGHLSAEQFCHDLREMMPRKASDEANEICRLVADMSENYRVQVFSSLTTARSHKSTWEQITEDAGQARRARKITDYMRDLHKYSKVSNPIMFALLCEYAALADSDSKRRREKSGKAKFVYKSSELLSSFFQRATHSMPGSFSPSLYEKGVADLSRQIASGECATAQDFLSALKEMDVERITSDAEYVGRMRTVAFASKSGQSKAKYVLARINEYIQKGLEVREDRTTTEHILPQGEEHLAKWGLLDGEHARCVHRLGNLTLLAPGDNKPKNSDNANFAAKKAVYEKSAYEITRELLAYEKWNEQSIGKRQARLAKLAAAVWRLKAD